MFTGLCVITDLHDADYGLVLDASNDAPEVYDSAVVVWAYEGGWRHPDFDPEDFATRMRDLDPDSAEWQVFLSEAEQWRKRVVGEINNYLPDDRVMRSRGQCLYLDAWDPEDTVVCPWCGPVASDRPHSTMHVTGNGHE